mmetsp:Transcript_16625/g.32490  ORF Transcript_16625/g.32490 Transcript_16625/m.32490 type:complete len:82 (-) Transcript_16625:434-679(-)
MATQMRKGIDGRRRALLVPKQAATRSQSGETRQRPTSSSLAELCPTLFAKQAASTARHSADSFDGVLRGGVRWASDHHSGA